MVWYCNHVSVDAKKLLYPRTFGKRVNYCPIGTGWKGRSAPTSSQLNPANISLSHMVVSRGWYGVALHPCCGDDVALSFLVEVASEWFTPSSSSSSALGCEGSRSLTPDLQQILLKKELPATIPRQTLWKLNFDQVLFSLKRRATIHRYIHTYMQRNAIM